MATMYELTADYLAVLEMANDPDIPPEAISDTLEGIEGEIEIKAENTAKVLKELEGNINTLKAEESRLNAKRKAIENNIVSIKKRLYDAMKLTGKEKFKTDLFSFNIQKNPVKVIIDDESKIPKKYITKETVIKIDKNKIKEDLKTGVTRKYAHLVQDESLRIK